MKNSPMKPKLIKMVVSSVIRDKVYKVFTESEWDIFQENGQFKGSTDDLRDGFIHLSAKDQIAGVIERFFAGKHPLYVAEFSDPEFIRRLKWEASTSNDLYPHLYDSVLLAREVGSFVIL